MIEFKDVTKVYANGVVGLNQISFKIEPGEFVAIIGLSGAGKSTLLRSINRLVKISEGDILIDKKSIKKNPIEAKKQFGFVPDVPDAFEKLTGLEYLNFIADVYEVPTRKRLDIVKRLSEEFGIMGELKDRIQTYSHGMKQKLLIISVVLHSPKNWILDEPLTGLDPKAAFHLKTLMREHADKGNTVFFSTHVLEVAEKICDKIAVIDKGKIIFVGTCEELKEQAKSSESLEESFLKIIEGTEENEQ